MACGPPRRATPTRSCCSAAAASLREHTGAPPFAAEAAAADAVLEDCRSRLAVEDLDAAHRRGQAMTVEEVLELALSRRVAPRT